jgi:hypothetical protein
VHAALEQTFAARAALMGRLLRAVVSGDEALAEAGGPALAGTSDDVAAVVQTSRGEPPATELQQRLDEQSAASLDYARGAVTGAATTERLRTRLLEASAQLGVALESASAGALPATTSPDAGDLVLVLVDAARSADTTAAASAERQLQDRLTRVGSELAASLVGAVGAAGAGEQQQQLAARWSLLFGEHAALTSDVVRVGLTGAGDFAVVAEQLNANTLRLTEAVGSVVPPDQAIAFATAWADQVDAVVAVVRATAEPGAAGRTSAQERLAASAQRLVDLLAEATGGRLAPTSSGPALTAHAAALVRQADAWAGRDAPGALVAATTDHVDFPGLAASAASAFTEAVASRAPVGGAATGLGGAADAVRSR